MFGYKTHCGKLPVQLTNRQICQNQMEKQTQEYSEGSSGTEFLLCDEKQTRGKQLEHLIYRANKKITSSEILCWTKSMNKSYYKFKCKEAANLKRTSHSVIAHLIAKKTTHYYTHKINIKTPTNTNEHNSSTLSPCQIRSGGCPVEWLPPSWGQFHHCIWSAEVSEFSECVCTLPLCALYNEASVPSVYWVSLMGAHLAN